MKRGSCTCSHHWKSGLRMGPCRHLLALKFAWLAGGGDADRRPLDESAASWYDRLLRWSGGA